MIASARRRLEPQWSSRGITLHDFFQYLFHFRRREASQSLRAKIACLEQIQQERVCNNFIRSFRNHDHIVLALRPDDFLKSDADLRRGLLGGLRALDRVLDITKTLLCKSKQMNICRHGFFLPINQDSPDGACSRCNRPPISSF